MHDADGNPAFTVYDVDPDTYEIMDAKVYIGSYVPYTASRPASCFLSQPI